MNKILSDLNCTIFVTTKLSYFEHRLIIQKLILYSWYLSTTSTSCNILRFNYQTCNWGLVHARPVDEFHLEVDILKMCFFLSNVHPIYSLKGYFLDFQWCTYSGWWIYLSRLFYLKFTKEIHLSYHAHLKFIFHNNSKFFTQLFISRAKK